MTRHLIAFCLFVLGGCTTTPSAETDIGFTYHDGLILVDAELAGRREVLCLIDTGANKSAIDRTLAETLDLEVTGYGRSVGTAGTIDVEMRRLGAVTLGHSRVDGIEVTVLDLAHIATGDDRRVGAILGSDVLGHMALDIDFGARRLRIHRKAPHCPHSIAMRIDNGIPRVKATLNGTLDTELRLDTGASLTATEDVYVNITTADWRRLRRGSPELKPERWAIATGIGGEMRLAIARVRSIQLGPLFFARPFVIVQPERGYFASADAVGFVGNNVLEKRGRVVIDYLGGRLGFFD